MTASAPLPPPPNVTPQKHRYKQLLQSPGNGAVGPATSGSKYAENLARSMTIDEIRELHRRALSEADAKQTELRLVLASRYRELVGSSDEVTRMRERAQELDELAKALPTLMEKLLNKSENKIRDVNEKESKTDDKNLDDSSKGADNDGTAVLRLRQELAYLPRVLHRAVDKNNVYEASKNLVKIFQLISEQTNEYPLATALSSSQSPSSSSLLQKDALLQSQMRMTYFHVETLPVKISQIARRILNSAASFRSSDEGDGTESSPLDPKFGAQVSAAALAALDILTIQKEDSSTKPIELLDMYFDAKAELLRSLLDQLNSTWGTQAANAKKENVNTTNAEEILSKIVLILQYDVVLHPYQIFVLRKFPTNHIGNNGVKMMDSLPLFPGAVVRTKTSTFLSAHLPLIRTKVKSVLVDIAGTTAAALGNIRQSLYDKTDGLECKERLDDSDGICTWEEALSGVVDVPSVLVGIGSQSSSSNSIVSSSDDAIHRFSLWAVLFSNTFSSLVHSLLTSSFQSVHTKLVSILRLSLSNAPPLKAILAHEAYRNTLHIASQLDSALLKVSDDAHELLVHAEERVESEKRLRQSLYVQTCEIMGRLICELRRMLSTKEKPDKDDGVKHMIVGRLCHLLKFRLTALSTLLDHKSSPAVLHHAGNIGARRNMISTMELTSAFELADDNDDGLITFQEAMEAVESAFSGTHFHGAQIVRETLLLPTSTGEKDTPGLDGSDVPRDVTLDELTLLLARGLRHDESGGQSALGAIQNSLDRMVKSSFQNWAKEIVQPYATSFSNQSKSFIEVSSSLTEEEFKRLFIQAAAAGTATSKGAVSNVSPHITSFLINITFALNHSICPSDSLLPVPYKEYAESMGVKNIEISRMIDVVRCALLRQGLQVVVGVLNEHVKSALEDAAPFMKESGPTGIAQLKNDLSFLQSCFCGYDQQGFCIDDTMEPLQQEIQSVCKKVDTIFRRVCNAKIEAEIKKKQEYTAEACDLFFSSFFGKNESAIPSMQLVGPGNESGEIASQSGGKTLLFHPPLVSNCRFPLLPIQADRTLSGVHARGKYREKEENNSRSERVGAVRAGLGFFSSMLKTS